MRSGMAPAAPPSVEPATSRARWTLGLVSATSALLVVDLTIVTVALPRIGSELGGSLTGLQWVLIGYAVAFGSLLQVSASIADLLGRRRVFLGGVAAFTATSAACALAWNVVALDIFRVLQGASGALIFANALPMIAQEFGGKARDRAIATWAALVTAAAAIAPLVGGLLVEASGWRAIFAVNVPLGLIALAVAVKHLPRSEAPRRVRLGEIDWAGAASLTSALVLLSLALTRGDAQGWTAPVTLLQIGGGALLLAAFIDVQRRAVERDRPPILDLRLLRIRSFTGAIVLSFLARFATLGTSVFLVLYLSGPLGLGPLGTGLALLPMFLGFLPGGLLSGRLQSTVPYRRLMALGFTLSAAAAVVLGIAIAAGAPAWVLAVPFFLWGFGGSLAMTPLLSTAVGVVPAERAGMASGMANSFLPIGTAAGTAVLGVVFIGVQNADAGRTETAVGVVMLCAAATSALAAVLALCLVRQSDLVHRGGSMASTPEATPQPTPTTTLPSPPVAAEPLAEPSPDPMASLLGLLRPIRGRLLGALGTSALAAVAGVGGVVLIAYALQEVLATDPDGARVATLLGAALGGLVLCMALRVIAFRVSHLASFDLEVTLRTRLTAHIGRLPLGRVQALGSGGLKKVLQDDVRALHGAVADATPLLGFGLAQPVAALVALGIVDWRLLLATLGIWPLIVVTMRMTMRDYPAQRRRYDEANEAINAAVVEFVQGMPVVRTFDDGTASFARFTDRVDAFTVAVRAWTETGRNAAILARIAMTPLPTLVIVLAVGTALTAAGSMEPTTLLVALLIGTLPVESVVPLIYLQHFIEESKAGAARITEVLALDPLPEPAAPRRPADASIRLRGVTFGYDGDRDRPALDEVSLDIPAGSVCALVGASGSGKSTIARLIPRFWDPAAGVVQVGGVDVREIDPVELLAGVALVFQDPFLLDDTIAANIRLGRPHAARAEIEAAARAARAHEFIVTELPDGYDTRVGERGGRLSGGQRQRITIARAMLSDAPIVVLDEATAFADPENEAAIQDGLARLTRGRTVVVIAHRLSTIVDADQIVVLDAGRVAQTGTHTELLAAGGIYARMWAHHEQAREWGMSVRPPAGIAR